MLVGYSSAVYRYRIAKDAEIPNVPIIATDVSAAPGAMNIKETEEKKRR